MTDALQQTLPDDVRIIDDLHLGRQHVLATYAILGDAPALVDPGPTSTLANLEAGLQQHGLAFDDIRFILLTHIHLDHAGVTGTLVERYPQIKVYVHERGAPHMRNPERLISSATQLYGTMMDELWGEMRPVPEQAITTLSGGETIHLGGRSLRVFYTPGHAKHHVTFLDDQNGVAYVGDTAGVRPPGFASASPATPPPDIDLDVWQQSLDLLRDIEPAYLALTHFGATDEPAEHVAAYRARLVHWGEQVRQGLLSGEDEATQIGALKALADAEIQQHNSDDQARHYQSSPIEPNWRGLARYWRKHGIKG